MFAIAVSATELNSLCFVAFVPEEPSALCGAHVPRHFGHVATNTAKEEQGDRHNTGLRAKEEGRGGRKWADSSAVWLQ